MGLIVRECGKLAKKRDIRFLMPGMALLLAAVLAYGSQQYQPDFQAYERDNQVLQYQQYRRHLETSGADSALASLYSRDDDVFIQNAALLEDYQRFDLDDEVLAAAYASNPAMASFDPALPVLLTVLFSILLGMTLLTQEWEGDLIFIQRGLSKGGWPLYGAKIIAVWWFSWLLFAILLAVQFLTHQLLYGWLDWSLPVQSAPVFLYSALPIRLWQGALLIWAAEGAGLLVWSTVLVCMGCWVRQRNAYMILVTALLAAEFSLYRLILHQDRLHFLKQLNLTAFLDGSALWRRPVYLIWQKRPVPWAWLCAGFGILILLLAVGLGYCGWRMKRAVTRSRRMHRQHREPKPKRVPAFERRKLWRSQRAIVILAVLLAVSVYTALQFRDYKDTRMYYYDVYCRKTAGLPLDDAEAVLDAEAAAFDGLQAELETLRTRYRAGEIDSGELSFQSSEIQRKLLPLESLNILRAEVEELRLRERAEVINQRDWNRLAGIEGIRDLIFGLICFAAAMLLGLGQLYFGDRDRQMVLIQTATPFGRPAVDRAKHRLAIRFGQLGYLFAVLPLLICKCRQLKPVGWLSPSTAFLTLRGAVPWLPMLGWLLVLYIAGWAWGMLMLFLIERAGRRVKTLAALWGQVFGLILAPLMLLWILLGLSAGPL